MDKAYLLFLRELVNLGIYKVFGSSSLGLYRRYYLLGHTPYDSIMEVHDEYIKGAFDFMDKHIAHSFPKLETPPSQQLSFF